MARKKEAFTNPPMTSREIRALLILNGVTNRQIAERFDVHESMVSQVIGGYEKSHRIQAAIAEAIQKEFDDVWPKKIAS
jgi:DNA-binding CsgD family transcriptional regulator